MSIEMGEVDHKIVVCKMRAHNVVLQVFRVDDREVHHALLVHDVHGDDHAIGGVALYDISSHHLHQVLGELRPMMIRLVRLSCGIFHRHAQTPYP